VRRQARNTMRENARTTLALDAETIEDLHQAARAHGGISGAIESALKPLVEYYSSKREYQSYTGKMDEYLAGVESRFARILDMAKKETNARSAKQPIRKTIVIEPRSLQCLNKAARDHSVRRDAIVKAAMACERELLEKLNKLCLDSTRQLFDEIKRHNEEILSSLADKFALVEKCLIAEGAAGFNHLLYGFDPGMGCLDVCDAFERDIASLEKAIAQMEEESKAYTPLPPSGKKRENTKKHRKSKEG